MRESRYFTALKAYKHGAPGRKSRSLSSKPSAEPRRLQRAGSRSREPGAGSREPGAGGAQLPGRSQAPRPGQPREHALEDGAPLAPGLPKQSPSHTARQAPIPSRCRERLRSSRGTAVPSASWGLWTKVTDSPSTSASSSSRLPAFPFCSSLGQRLGLLAESRGGPGTPVSQGAQVAWPGGEAPSPRPGRGAGQRLQTPAPGQCGVPRRDSLGQAVCHRIFPSVGHRESLATNRWPLNRFSTRLVTADAMQLLLLLMIILSFSFFSF